MKFKGVILVVMVLALIFGVTKIDAGMPARLCKVQRRVLVSTCQELIYRKPPSPYCCRRLRVTPSECICEVITPKLALLIDVSYAVGVMRRCGRKIPRHYKCGSITLP
ncbi:hypothetical protein ACHQM5_022552 [Ranunculus cassubicifolius]